MVRFLDRRSVMGWVVALGGLMLRVQNPELGWDFRWVWLANAFALLGIAYVAMSGYLGLTIPVATALAATATMQLILPVPILAAALGDPLRDRSPLGRLGRHLLMLGLLVMIVFGTIGPTMGRGNYSIHRSGWVDRVQRTWVRGIQPVPVPKGRGLYWLRRDR